jgi:XTP/dITP diphosphohydrolase
VSGPADRVCIFASSNRGKLDEVRALLADSGITLLAQSEVGISAAAETAPTFVENALLKARHAAAIAGRPAIADDSGLCVDALGGAPGLYSARYAGMAATDADNIAKLLAALDGVGPPQRSARFVCAAVALVTPNDPDPLIATAHWHGEITRVASGRGGFGYDPVFYVASERCTAAELDPERKRVLSHRGQAFAALCAALRTRAGGV